MVNELVLGYNWRNEHEVVPADQLSKLTAVNVGFKTPPLFPNSNPLGLLPNVTFGGLPNTPNITLTPISEGGRYPTYVLTDNLHEDFRETHLEGRYFFQPARRPQRGNRQSRRTQLQHRCK